MPELPKHTYADLERRRPDPAEEQPKPRPSKPTDFEARRQEAERRREPHKASYKVPSEPLQAERNPIVSPTPPANPKVSTSSLSTPASARPSKPVSKPQVERPKQVSSIHKELRFQYEKKKEEHMKSRQDSRAAVPSRSQREEHKSRPHGTQPLPSTSLLEPSPSQENDDRIIAELLRKNLLEDQAREDALLARLLAEETPDIDYASADAELAQRLAEEDAAAAAHDQYYD
jgi:hypothetical protein